MLFNLAVCATETYKKVPRPISELPSDKIKDGGHGIMNENRGTQRPNVSKYVRSVSDGFLHALDACLASSELPLKLFIR